MPEFTYKLAQEMFMTRDDNAVSEFNNWMAYHNPSTDSITLARLEFLESRLTDLCSVVMRTLIELDKDLPRS